MCRAVGASVVGVGGVDAGLGVNRARGCAVPCVRARLVSVDRTSTPEDTEGAIRSGVEKQTAAVGSSRPRCLQVGGGLVLVLLVVVLLVLRWCWC